MNTTLIPTHENPGSLVPVDKTANRKEEARVLARKCEIDEDSSKWLLDSIWDKCEKLDENDWLRVKQNMIKAQKYYDGRQYGRVNDACEWNDYNKKPGEINYVENIYHAHIQTALMELSRGQVRLNFTYASTESRQGDIIARLAEARYVYHRQKLFKPLKMAHENLSLLLNGIALRYTYVVWDDDKRSSKMPRFEEHEEAGEEMMVCGMCGKPKSTAPQPEMPGTDADPCDGCGSSEVESLQAPISGKVISGYDQGKLASNFWVSPDPLGITFDLHAQTLGDSAYILWSQAILTDVLQSQYPNIEITPGLTSKALKDQHSVSGSTPNVQTGAFSGAKGEKNLSEFQQGWFDYSLYCHKVLKADITLSNGTVIPKGTKLGEVFPDGMYIARNGKKILDLWNESKSDKWTASPYVTRIGTLIGGGTSVALDNQDRINDIVNLQMASVMQDSFRKEFVQTRYLEGENVPNDPTERAVVTNLPEGGRIVGTVIDALPPSSLSSDAYGLPESIQGSIQNQLGTFSATSSGMPDLKAAQNTASGMALLRDITVGRYFPMLEVRADALDAEQAYQLLINDQKYLSVEQWKKYAGDYNEEAIKLFLECDIRNDLIITVVPESFMPETPSQKLSKTIGFTEIVTQGAGMLPPELMAHIATQFGVPKSIIGFDAVYAMAMGSIQTFAEIAEEIVGQFGDVQTYDLNDPQTFALAMLVLQSANIPVVPEMDDTATLTDAYQDWWKKDAGRSSSNLLKATVILRTEQLKQGTTASMVDEAKGQMEAQQPLIEQQQAQQADEAQLQSQLEAEKMAQTIDQQADQQAGQTGEAEMERAHQRETQAADHQENERQRSHEMSMAKQRPQSSK